VWSTNLERYFYAYLACAHLPVRTSMSVSTHPPIPTRAEPWLEGGQSAWVTIPPSSTATTVPKQQRRRGNRAGRHTLADTSSTQWSSRSHQANSTSTSSPLSLPSSHPHLPLSLPSRTSSSHTRGRYLPPSSFYPPTSKHQESLQPKQVLQAASALASLAGHDMYITGK